MNKKDVLDILNKYSLETEKYTIISGAAMVLYGIKEKTNDIDITVSEEYEKALIKKYNPKIERIIEDGNKKYTAYIIDDIINFSTHYYGEYKDEKIESYNVQTPEEILKLKQKLNRKKDEIDIKKIKEYINKANINSLALAYLGDAVYELYIRKYLIDKNLKVKDLQKKAIDYVSAKAQSKFLDKMIDDNFLNPSEIEIIKRARNHKSHSSKSTDIVTYKKSTGLEALIGYLEITNNKDRLEEIMNYIVGE